MADFRASSSVLLPLAIASTTGWNNDPYRLDSNHDGVACESLP